MRVKCDYCNSEFEKTERLRPHNFCCRKHFNYWNSKRVSDYNKTDNPMNKPGGVYESRIKRGNMLRYCGDGKSYTKMLGRHEHRIVAEQKIGRRLDRYEYVHHINGNKHDNRPENLMIVSPAEHAKIHSTRKR